MSNPRTTPDDLSPRERTRVLGVLLVPLFMSLVGVSIVNVALSAIQSDLHASPSALQWVLTGYALSFGVALVPSGRAGDVYGRRTLFMSGIVVFALASLVCGLAPNTTVLNLARVVQGVGSGLLNPQTVGMIQQYFRGPARAKAFGMFGAVVGLAVAVGPVLGGLLIGTLGAGAGWRAAFLINTPIAAVALILAVRWLPRTRRQPGRADLDPVGALMFGAGTLLILLPFVESRWGTVMWLSPVVGGLLLFAWARWERRYKRRGRQPMVDLQLFRTASFSYGAALIALYFLGMTSVWIVVALYAQRGLGRTALEAGLLSLPAALVSAAASPLAGRAVLRYGRMVALVGIGSAMLGLLSSVAVVHAVVHDNASPHWLYVTLAFIGLGQAAVVAPNQTLSFADVPLEFAGAAGGVLQTGQRVGTAVGTAVITAVLFAVLERSDWHTAFTAGFLTIVGVLVLVGAVAFADLRRRTHDAASTREGDAAS